MTVETTVPAPETIPEPIEPSAPETTETAPEATDGAVTEETTEPVTEGTDPTIETFYEDLFLTEPVETIAETTEPVVIVDVIETVGSDLAHVSLFGSFLICGTLIGLQLLRDRHGN